MSSIEQSLFESASVDSNQPSPVVLKPGLLDQVNFRAGRQSPVEHYVPATESGQSPPNAMAEFEKFTSVTLVTCLGGISRYASALEEPEHIVTDYSFQLIEVLRGRGESTITVNGGKVGDISLIDYESPKFAEGSTYLAAYIGPQEVQMFYRARLVRDGAVQFPDALVPLDTLRARLSAANHGESE